jgi:hypothetical protein
MHLLWLCLVVVSDQMAAASRLRRQPCNRLQRLPKSRRPTGTSFGRWRDGVSAASGIGLVLRKSIQSKNPIDAADPQPRRAALDFRVAAQ